MNNIIVGMGEALWDVLPEGKKIGGAPANFAYHVSQFGFDSRVVSAVGNDELGDEIMSVFKEKKLNTQIERVDYPTGTVQVTLDAEGVPCYEIKEGVAWDNIPFTDELKRLALNTRAVCFGSLAQRNEASRATINRFLDTMPEIDGQLKIFDINLRQDFYTKEVLRDSFQRCNVLKINDEELVTISRMFGYPGIDLQDKCWILLAKYNLKMLILTCGINGSYVFTPGVVSFQETPKVPVADTVGAGDSFTAAFCASILNGKVIIKYICSSRCGKDNFPHLSILNANTFTENQYLCNLLCIRTTIKLQIHEAEKLIHLHSNRIAPLHLLYQGRSPQCGSGHLELHPPCRDADRYRH